MKNIKKGHLTAMWNVLFKQAYDDNNDYFFQCGDDINFHTKTSQANILQNLSAQNVFHVHIQVLLLQLLFQQYKLFQIFNFFLVLAQITNTSCSFLVFNNKRKVVCVCFYIRSSLSL